MITQATPVAEIPLRRRNVRGFVTEQLGVILEQRSVRAVVVATMLVLASMIDLLPALLGLDSGWMFVVPVLISAVAGGLLEGLVVAFVSSVLVALYGTVLQQQPWDPALLLGLIAGRFALYGITAAFIGVFAEAHHSVQLRFKELASKDPLTQVANVASFYEHVGVLEHAGADFAVLVVDIDDLKVINDRHGHQVGSASIRTVANVLGRVVRSSDCVARYGGDEFVVILKHADRPGAQVVSNRVRDMLRDEAVPGVPDLRVSVSIGAAMFGDDGTTSEELLECADRAMYRDKRSRRAGR